MLQTLVDVPLDVVVTTFTIAFSGMDDGSRVTLFNSLYPTGLLIPGSYVFLGGSGTADLGAYVVPGEVNRVIVTQVDDCCVQNNLHSALVVLNGEVVQAGCTSNEECSDGNACTTDTCQPDGSCGHATLSCDDQSLCTIDAYDTAIGCVYQALSCDDANRCTLDTCAATTGCAHGQQCPDCSAAVPTVSTIWPPNHKLVEVGVSGVTDPQNQAAAITIDSIWQDEPTNTTGDGNTCVDGGGIGTTTASVRAERAGTPKVPGNGRVYHIAFTATDPDGNFCVGEVASCVPHDKGVGDQCVDEGAVYDSLVCE